MSAFDMNINVGDYGFSVPDEEAIAAGAPPRMSVILNIVQVLGVQGGQVATMPFGSVNFGMGREDAIRFFKAGLEQAEQLPAESKLTIANDMTAAERMGKDIDTFRNGTG